MHYELLGLLIGGGWLVIGILVTLAIDEFADSPVTGDWHAGFTILLWPLFLLAQLIVSVLGFFIDRVANGAYKK